MHRLAPVVLVALGGVLVAPVFAGCAEDSEVVKTVTVAQPAAAPSSSPSEQRSKHRREQSREEQAPAAPATAPGYVHCDSNIEVKAETTTCAFAQNAFWHYWTSDESSQIQVYSPATRSTFDVSCAASAGRVVCTTDARGRR